MNWHPQFEKEFYGEFVYPTERERRALEAAEVYEGACQAHDRRICGRDGIPKDQRQRHEIDKFANQLREKVLLIYQVTKQELQQALTTLRHTR